MIGVVVVVAAATPAVEAAPTKGPGEVGESGAAASPLLRFFLIFNRSMLSELE